ncbi:sensor histidine kinase [Mucilaginibacter dorajii]|uniref:Signal transduction histidine kinase internal region domain-containing protein n=1 Tax=Mucilaginibacter dorajii TaxID=692994 RepID=A0ABP7P370_9SPHI|nr:histidine kinase [Mucilaginibacter dorajii]MCS3734317.1 sensor histidine kinase YesM [Mucilaginibacter dorajii]
MKTFDWTRLFTWPYKVYTQLVFWVIVFFLYILLKEYPQRMTGITLVCMILQEMLELAIPCYAQNLLVLPFLKRRKWLAGIGLYLVQLIILINFLPYLLNWIGQLFAALFHITDVVTNWQDQHFAFSMVAFTVMASLAKVGVDRLIRDKEQKENELRHLKAQLNPHFLFNTLNNLYGLSVAESKKLPGLMLRLSELLRYSLYDTNQNYVAVQKELDYISNYVELERIRLSDKTDIKLDISGDYADQYVAPLLLIIFVENSFKHFSAVKGHPVFVHIQLDVKDSHLHLRVKNSVDPEYVPVQNKSKGGLGLNNVKQRLDLIYPQQYKLTTAKQNEYFEVNLEIDLS